MLCINDCIYYTFILVFAYCINSIINCIYREHRLSVYSLSMHSMYIYLMKMEVKYNLHIKYAAIVMSDFVVKRELHRNAKRTLCEVESILDKHKEIIKVYQQSEVLRLGIPKIRRKADLFQKLHSIKITGVLPSELCTSINDTISILFKCGNVDYTMLGDCVPIVQLKDYVDVVLQILNIFWNIHRLGFLHNDIAMECIAFDPTTNQVILVDIGEPTEIGIGSTLSGADPATNDGILNYNYTSPEHTGRTRNVIDQRSDIYSLGVVLFELASGNPPFVADDPIELVHLHMSQPPPDISPPPVWAQTDPVAGAIISAIIHKMLRKSPEDRYSSLYAVVRDFEVIQDALTCGAPLKSFAIAEHDMEDSFHLPKDKLYGREQEIQDLSRFLETFNEAVPSTSAMLLVGGHPGVGKSTLIRHIYSKIYEGSSISTRSNPPILLGGKYDQIKHTPYSAIIGALGGMTKRLLSGKGYLHSGR